MAIVMPRLIDQAASMFAGRLKRTLSVEPRLYLTQAADVGVESSGL